MAEKSRRRLKDIFRTRQVETENKDGQVQSVPVQKIQQERWELDHAKDANELEKEKVIIQENQEKEPEKQIVKEEQEEEFISERIPQTIPEKSVEKSPEKEPEKVPEQPTERYNEDLTELLSKGEEISANDLLRVGVQSGSLALTRQAIEDLGAVPEAIFDKDDLENMAETNPDLAKYLRSNWSQEASDLDRDPGEVTPVQAEVNYGFDPDKTWLDRRLEQISKETERSDKPYYVTKSVRAEEMEEDYMIGF